MERHQRQVKRQDGRHTYSTVMEPFDRHGMSIRSHRGGAVTAE
jgi:hypothetical protein